MSINEKDRQTISALLDNEADDLELRRLLKAMEQDTELAQTWERMNLAQAVLHDENLQDLHELLPLSGSLSQKVAQAIALEPTPSTNKSPLVNWQKPLARIGIAASVALAFFVGMQTTIGGDNIRTNGGVPVAEQNVQLPGQSFDQQNSSNGLLVAETAVQEVDPEARKRLEDYINSVSITREEPQQLEQLQDSPLYRLVNEIKSTQ